MNSFENKISRYLAQQKLFKPMPSRLEIQSIQLSGEGHPLSVNVWRNHAFEPLIELMTPYFSFGGIEASFKLSDYDDTLSFSNHTGCDVELLYLDRSRYSSNPEEWSIWLSSRLEALRTISDAPIIVVTDGELAEFSDRLFVNFANIEKLCNEHGVKLLDQRTASISGTPVSGAAQILIARELACHWLPASALPPIKAIALDLDNTLHGGILLEDGVENLLLSPSHIALQNYLKFLKERGIFLTLVSRNVEADVIAMFERRADYPLRWADFSATEVSWDDKASGIERVARKLNIGIDSVLFVDDNIGELLNATGKLGELRSVQASDDALITKNSIEYFPGLWRWRVGDDDKRRVADVMANSQRKQILEQSVSEEDYFRGLQICLKFNINPREQISRVAELCGKTNQFNMSSMRLGEAEISKFMDDENSCVVSIEMSDRLTNSGIIGVLVARRENRTLLILELCVSCRALGRKLENSIVIGAVKQIPLLSGCDDVVFNVVETERNMPARDWLANCFGSEKKIAAQRIVSFKIIGGVEG